MGVCVYVRGVCVVGPMGPRGREGPRPSRHCQNPHDVLLPIGAGERLPHCLHARSAAVVVVVVLVVVVVVAVVLEEGRRAKQTKYARKIAEPKSYEMNPVRPENIRLQK